MNDLKDMKLKPIAVALGTALAASVAAGSVAADDELFVAEGLDRGYDVLAVELAQAEDDDDGEDGDDGEEGSCGEGKCGEGKCGTA